MSDMFYLAVNIKGVFDCFCEYLVVTSHEQILTCKKFNQCQKLNRIVNLVTKTKYFALLSLLTFLLQVLFHLLVALIMKCNNNNRNCGCEWLSICRTLILPTHPITIHIPVPPQNTLTRVVKLPQKNSKNMLYGKWIILNSHVLHSRNIMQIVFACVELEWHSGTISPRPDVPVDGSGNEIQRVSGRKEWTSQRRRLWAW